MDRTTQLIVVAVVLAVLSVVFGGLMMVLWNMVVPDLFSGPRLSFGQSIGLFWLCQFLTGGIFGMTAAIVK